MVENIWGLNGHKRIVNKEVEEEEDEEEEDEEEEKKREGERQANGAEHVPLDKTFFA